MRKLLILVAALALSSAVFAQSLTVYSSVDEENAAKLMAAFTKATGINVDFVFLSSGPAMARIEAESNRPQADVWFGAPSENHALAADRGLTQPYDNPNADALADNFKGANGAWYGMYTNPLAIGARTDILASRGLEAPESWADLLDPAYEGLLQMPSPQSSGTAYAVILTLKEIFGEDGAFDYLKKLNPNVQTYTQSGTAPGGALGLGEVPLGLQFTPAFLKLVDEGFPVSVIFPTEGVGYEVAAVSILKDAKNLEQAQALVDWITSVEGQQAIVDSKTYFLPVRPEVSAGEGIPTLDSIKLVSYDAAEAAERREELVDRWVDEVLGQ